MKGQALTYIEIDVDYCSNVYGTSPCAAELGVTGDKKCFNSLKTCQDRGNFRNSPATLRFAVDCDYLPKDIDVLAPSVTNVSFSPATISLGEDLGIRASLTVTFKDHPSGDASTGLDKYYSDRSYSPFSQGTFWGKFRARHPYLRGRSLRWVMGFTGQAIGDMETRHFIIDSFNGPTPDGRFTITAKDVLKLADDERAQAPFLSNGSLLADITSGATSFTVTPDGIGAEYRTSGHIAVGGKEIMSYTRNAGGIDTDTLLCCHFDGANNATTTTDSSSGARTLTANGNAKLSTTDKKFGTASSVFDGTGDFWSLADNSVWTFASNFTLDCWANITTLASARTLFSHSNANLTDMHRLYVTTTGALAYEMKSGGSTLISVQTDDDVVTAATWQHLAVVRYSSAFYLFVDGYVRATAFYSGALPDYTGTFKIGISGDGTSDAMLGYIDEARVSKAARWIADFFTYGIAYDSSDPDVFTVTRAQYNTTAIAAKAEDLVQQCLIFTGQDPADIMYELLVRYARIPREYLPLSDWQAESDSYLSRVYTTCIAQPVGVNSLMCELIQQTASAMWWDDLTQTLRWQVLRTISTEADTYDYRTIMEKTLSATEQPNSRVSQCYVFYGQRNPLEPLENETNYRSAQLQVALQEESDYGSAVIKKIYSRWIPQFGATIAERITDIVLGRYKNPPRAFSFEVFRRTDNRQPQLGGGYNLSAHSLQTDEGAADTVPIQVTRISPKSEKFVVEAQEAIFESDAVIDLLDRVITIDADTYDFNLRTIHDTLFPVITDPTGITLTVHINSGITVGATTQASRAFDVGSFPSALPITINLRGKIGGHGGKGGSQAGGNAEAGGTAFYTRKAVTLNVYGSLWGGGGGGGHANTCAGGGGAGRLPGQPGVLNAGSTPAAGTENAGGVGSIFSGIQFGGTGGAPGQAGNSGTGVASQSGGAAGRAIDGVSYVTLTNSGDIRGTQVN